jgi:hypothetical protein
MVVAVAAVAPVVVAGQVVLVAVVAHAGQAAAIVALLAAKR